ncbi:MAG: alpha/beta hydrolase fold domain-containing protein [Halothece sp.]
MIILPLLSLIVAVLGIFLTIWIVFPAPTMFLLPFGVVAPEVSPLLVGGNAIALLLITLFFPSNWLQYSLILSSAIALIISTLPLIEFPKTHTNFTQEMETQLGSDYLKEIPEAVKTKLRPQPLAVTDILRGISLPEIRIQRDIPFANPEGVELTLNTYHPLETGKYPTLVIIYGGAWRQGKPSNNEAFSRYMANQNYTVITIDYRHAPKHQFPAQLEDVQRAIQYIQDHAQELEVDTERMAIMGRSAGGHLAMLAAYQPKAIQFRAVVNYYSPINLSNGYYDLPFPDPINIQSVLRNFLGGTPEELPERYQEASPSSYLKPNLPPSLLVYAGRDHLVQAKFGKKLDQNLQAKDNLSVYLEIPWAEHAFDAVFSGVSNQLALYHTERFLAWALR